MSKKWIRDNLDVVIWMVTSVSISLAAAIGRWDSSYYMLAMFAFIMAILAANNKKTKK